MKKIFLSSPHMGGDEMGFIQDAFDKNWIAPLGENVDEFEKETAKRMGAGYGAALSAGTAAIHMAMRAAGVGKGDVAIILVYGILGIWAGKKVPRHLAVDRCGHMADYIRSLIFHIITLTDVVLDYKIIIYYSTLLRNKEE